MQLKIRFLGATLCGILFALQSSAQSPAASGAPFFDFSNERVISNVMTPQGLRQGPVDITPEPVRLSSIDEAVLAACGPFGTRISPQVVRRITDNLSPDLMKALGREFPEMNATQLRAALGEMWSRNNGFEHIFCGQPSNQKVGGLHFAARYLELQQKNIISRLQNNIANEEIIPQNVYTVGIQVWNGVADRKKGFSPRQSAEDIFYEGSRTFLRNCRKPSKNRVVCNSRFFRDGAFYNLFVCLPNSGVITMYPVAQPASNNPVCR